MLIAYIGNFTQSHCTEVHLAATLRDLEHEVIELQENDAATERYLDNIAVHYKMYPDLKPDLLLFTRTWGETLTLEHLEEFKKLGIPTASYHLDLYVGLTRKYLNEIEMPDGTKRIRTLDEMLQTDPFWRTDFVFTPDGDPDSAKVFKRNGVKHYYMKPGVFKPECYIDIHAGIVTPKYPPNDVIFVGGGARPGEPNGYGHPEWPYRDELVAWLQDTYGDKFTKYGHPQATVRNAELNRLYAESKIVVGDSVCLPYGEFTHTHYWSDRVYETIGRGGFLIHPYIKGLEEEFRDGETIVFYKYGDFDDLKKKIDYYLEHDEEREAIREAGQYYVKLNATYNNRLTKMLDIIAQKSMDYSSLEIADGTDIVNVPPIKINMGAGSEPTPGWTNLDWKKQDGIDIVHNLLDFPYPFEDGEADEIKAIDVLEHLPPYNSENQSTVIGFIEECHRILVPGGKLTIQVPCAQSPRLWIDPTHVRGYELESFDYFDPDKDYGRWYPYYSECKFSVQATQMYFTDEDTGEKLKGNIIFEMVKHG